MVDTFVFLSIIFDLLPSVAVIFLLIKLSNLDKANLSHLAKDFVAYRKEKIFRNLVMIVVLAFVLNSVALTFYLFDVQWGNIIEISQIVSDTLLTVSIIYFINSPKHMHLLKDTVKKQ
jgi:hypothetical protein